MPINHSGNTLNGNKLRALASTTGSSLRGRTTTLQIFDVPFFDFNRNDLAGQQLMLVVRSIEKDNNRDLVKGYRQPTDHNDLLGNLPAAPVGGVVYREYFLPANGFGWPGFVRLVADLKNKRLFITPTHYDTYLVDSAAAAKQDVTQPVLSTAAGAQNPFFILTGVGAVNDLFR